MEYFDLAKAELQKICHENEAENWEALYCRLHNEEHLGKQTDDGHNCLACNLQDGTCRIFDFLDGYKSESVEDMFTMYILLLYLQVEKLHTVFKFVGITMDYVEKHWNELIEIRKWANFIKHPKGFLFTHHPHYMFEDEKIKLDKNTQKIDYSFVQKFYSREDENKFRQLIQEIGNKRNIIVVLPTPQRLASAYVRISREFCLKIKENPHFKEILKQHTTIDDYQYEV